MDTATSDIRAVEFTPMEFVHDQLALGQKLRILTVVDTHSRFCPALDACFGYRGEDVVQALEKMCGRIGYPKTIRGDNGKEFMSRDLDLWAYAKGVPPDFSRSGKPSDNGFILRRGKQSPGLFADPSSRSPASSALNV